MRSVSAFSPDIETASLSRRTCRRFRCRTRSSRVLDFGCGLGRNFPYLTSFAREVVGFELPPMIERCRTLSDHPVTLLTSDWQEV